VIDELVNELADKREDLSHRLEPTKYSLKRVFWSEYDPAYAYLNDRGHNSVRDNRPKLSASNIEPMVHPRPLSSYHILTRPLYTVICHDLDLWMILRVSLRHYYYEIDEEIQAIVSNFKSIHDNRVTIEDMIIIKTRLEESRARWTISYLAMQRAVHLLTIIMHHLVESAAAVESAAEDHHHPIFGLLLQDEVVGMKEDDLSKFFHRPSLWKGLLHATSALQSSTTTVANPSSASASASAASGNNPDEYRIYLKWIVETLRRHPNAPDIIKAAADPSETGENDMVIDSAVASSTEKSSAIADAKAIKMQRARDRALKKVQKSAAKFKAAATPAAAPATPMEEEEDPTAEAIELLAAAEEEEMVCMTCRSPGSESDRLCYLAYRQRSRVTHPHPSADATNPRQVDYHLSFCGHVMHFSCYDQHFKSIVARTDDHYGLLLYDPFIGQSPCPLCKRLNNRLVPICPPSNSFTAKKDMEVEEVKVGQGFSAWMKRWISWSQVSRTEFEFWSQRYPMIIAMDPSLKDHVAETASAAIPIPTQPAPSASAAATGSGSAPASGSASSSRSLFASFFRSPASTSPTASVPINPGNPVDFSAVIAAAVAGAVNNGTGRVSLRISAGGQVIRDSVMTMGPESAGMKFLDDFGSEMNDVVNVPSSLWMQIQSICQSMAYTIACQEMAMHLSSSSSDSSDQPMNPNHRIKPIDRKGLQYMLQACVHGILEADGNGGTELRSQRGTNIRSHLQHLLGNAFLGRSSSYNPQPSEARLFLVDDGLPLLLKPLYPLFILLLIMNQVEVQVSGDKIELEELEYLIQCLSVAQLAQYITLEEFWLPNLVSTATSLSAANSPTNDEYPSNTREIFEILLNRLNSGMNISASSSHGYDKLFQAWKMMDTSLRYVAWVFGYESVEMTPLKLDQMNMEEVKAMIKLWKDDLDGYHGDMILHRQYIRDLSIPSSQHALYRQAQASSADGLASLYMLPISYTNLHASISQQYGYEAPAVCLTCGQVLDTKERGVCMKHNASCSGEAGLFFLLQDASILLLHGPRTCYVSGPYADETGEHPRTFRGRPLTLDQRRMKILTKMWLEHEIVREVMLKRSTSQRVIILGHY
jgi:hypothetical protein